MQESAGISDDKRTLESAKQRIETLKHLRNESIITDDEYTARREQIINELTGTTAQSIQERRKGSKTSVTMTNQRSLPIVDDRSRDHYAAPPVIRYRQSHLTQLKKHPPPDWNSPKYPTEQATKITYDFNSKEWNREDTKVMIDVKPFDEGGLRLVFHLKDLKNPETAFVAKLSRDPRDNVVRSIYFEDVRMQAVAAHFAMKFNKYDPPKKIEFLPAFIMELVQREGSPVCGVERFISGHYRKYNNNRGWISEDERNTPSAFSHFTWEASDGGLLICDIQGVDDVYTDPQIHSKGGGGFGKGNLGVEGIDKFLETHKCNAICRFLGLANINKKPIMNEGTIPHRTKMKQQQITRLNGITLMSKPLVHDDRYSFPALRKTKRPIFCGCNIL